MLETTTARLGAGAEKSIELLDTRTPLLEEVYEQLRFAIEEAVATGRFTRLTASVGEAAQAFGLDRHAIYIDAERIYLELETDRHRLLAVIRHRGPRTRRRARGRSRCCHGIADWHVHRVRRFLIARGVDVMPLLMLGGLGLLFYFALDPRQEAFSLSRGAGEVQATAPVDRHVGGQNREAELLEALQFISDTQTVEHLGIRPLRGILLVGPPGTGKTCWPRLRPTA